MVHLELFPKWRLWLIPFSLWVAFIGSSRILQAGEGETWALKASKVLTGTGQCIEGGMILIQDKKILSMGPDLSLPKGAKLMEFGDGVICPGLIDPYTALGAEKDNSEPVSAIQPGARVEEAFDPWHKDFQEALSCGITTVLVTPSKENVIGGCAVAVKTYGSSRNARILRSIGPLMMTVSSGCFKRDRMPTSRIGAMDLLHRTLTTVKEPGVDTAYPVLKELIESRHPVFFVAEESFDLLAGLSFKEEFDLRLSLIGASEADLVLEDLKGKDIPLVFGPFDFSTPERILRVPAAAKEAGIPLAFTAQSPQRNPAYLRITAALAVKAGLDPETALSGLTSRSAALAGIEKRVGFLAPGMDADLLVFSDHPMNLSARLLRVYIDGQEAFRECKKGVMLQGDKN